MVGMLFLQRLTTFLTFNEGANYLSSLDLQARVVAVS